MKYYSFFLFLSVMLLHMGCDSSSSNSEHKFTGLQDPEASAREQTGLPDEGTQFVQKAAQGGLLEVRLGEMAQEKAGNESVRQFGQHMVSDHGKANQELKALAGEKNISIPDTLTLEGQQHVEKLSQLSGEAFDREYMNLMVKEHEKDVNTFEQAGNSVEDTAIQNFASSKLPVLKQHLQMADSLQQQMQDM